MQEAIRGKVISDALFRQKVLFEGVKFGNITPTDIDGLIEYHDKGYILYELKRQGTRIPDGQRMALERMTKDFQKSGKKAACFLCYHNNRQDEDIRLQQCNVRAIYFNGTWSITNRNVNEATEKFLRYCDS